MRLLTTMALLAPAAPTVLSVSCIAGAQIDGTFVASVTPGVTAQRVYRRIYGTGIYVQVGSDLSAAATSFSDSTGSAGVRYQYVVRAVKNGVESLDSVSDSAYTDALYDTFTEGVLTVLSSHTPNCSVEAGAYTQRANSGGSMYIGAQTRAQVSAGTGNYYYTKNLAISDAVMRFNYIKDATAGTRYKGVAARHTGTVGNQIEFLYAHTSGGAKELDVQARSGGTVGDFAVASIGTGAGDTGGISTGTHACVITLSGSSVAFTLGAYTANLTTTTHQTATHYGLIVFETTTRDGIDNLRVNVE